MQFIFPGEFFLCPPPISCRKNVALLLVWPKIVMTLPTLKDMIGIIKRDQLLPYDKGRRQYDIQEQVSKITSRIDTILSTNNPGAAGKFYTTNYVLVPADQLILRANIMKLSELPENISDMDRSIKAHLNTLFHSKTGNLIRGEEYSKSFDEDVITRLDEAKETANSELKYLNEKLDECKDMFRGVLLLKTKSRKRPQKQNKRKSKKRKQQRESKNFNCFVSFCLQT